RADAPVSFQDYHLHLAPAFVREQRPEARLTHFLHIPWSQPDYWHALPEEIRRAVHDALCANDIVGFHTERWRRNFVQSCEAITDCRTETAVNPIGIDADEFDLLKESPRVLEEEQHIVESRP